MFQNYVNLSSFHLFCCCKIWLCALICDLIHRDYSAGKSSMYFFTEKKFAMCLLNKDLDQFLLCRLISVLGKNKFHLIVLSMAWHSTWYSRVLQGWLKHSKVFFFGSESTFPHGKLFHQSKGKKFSFLQLIICRPSTIWIKRLLSFMLEKAYSHGHLR